MAKKTTKKKSTIDDQSNILDQMTPAVCQLKHIAIDKELESIKDQAEKRHEEIKSIIGTLQEGIKKDVEASHDNLKDKIVLTEKTIGDKIDSLSAFDDTLKGNGKPGVWESIRMLKWKFTAMISLLVVITIILIGGSVKGVTKEKIKKFFGYGSTTTTKKVEPAKKEVTIVKEAKPLTPPK